MQIFYWFWIVHIARMKSVVSLLLLFLLVVGPTAAFWGKFRYRYDWSQPLLVSFNIAADSAILSEIEKKWMFKIVSMSVYFLCWKQLAIQHSNISSPLQYDMRQIKTSFNKQLSLFCLNHKCFFKASNTLQVKIIIDWVKFLKQNMW